MVGTLALLSRSDSWKNAIFAADMGSYCFSSPDEQN